MKPRVFVFEYLSGGGRVDAAPAEAASLTEAGTQMRDAIVADLLRADCAVSAAAICGGSATARGSRRVELGVGVDPFDHVAREAALHDFTWIVAPETDGLLARLQRGVPAARWLGCEPAAIALAGSKAATLELLAAAGVTTPLAFAPARAKHWIVKPDDGAGSIETRLHRDRAAAQADLAERRGRGKAVVLEPWVEGDALSLSLCCRDRGCELLSVNRQHLACNADGWLTFEGVRHAVIRPGDPRHAALDECARHVHAAIDGLRGFVGIDVVWHAQREPVVIEVNPRVTSAYVGLSERLQRNIGAAVLAAHSPEAVAAHA